MSLPFSEAQFLDVLGSYNRALWAVIATSAALTLGIWADSVLLACAGLLAIDMLAPHALGAPAGQY
jgi:hypothetical protein